MHFDLISIIEAFGSIGIISIIFAESGLFFGFFLPGDSLLFTAGILSSKGLLPFFPLLIALPVAAVLGDSVGYWFGNKVGEKLFAKKESRFFKPKHVDEAHKFFVKHGKKALVLARFVPIFRTFVPIVAGVAKMPYKDFISYNIIGGVSWTLLMFLMGHFLGNALPETEGYMYYIIIAILVISTLPIVYEYIKSKKLKVKS